MKKVRSVDAEGRLFWGRVETHDGLAGLVVDHGEGGARVHDGSLVGEVEVFAVDGGFLGL